MTEAIVVYLCLVAAAAIGVIVVCWLINAWIDTHE